MEFAGVAEVANQSALGGQVVVVGDDHAPFAGGHRLGGCEAEDSHVADRAGELLLAVAGQVGLGGVFEDVQAVRLARSRIGPMSAVWPA